MRDKNFAGKKAIIVGASGGMGSVISKMLSPKGVHCALFGRDAKNSSLLDRFALHMVHLVLYFLAIFLIPHQLKNAQKRQSNV